MNEQNGVEEDSRTDWPQMNGSNDSEYEDTDSEGSEERPGYVLLGQEPSSDEEEDGATAVTQQTETTQRNMQSETLTMPTNNLEISNADEVRRAMSGFMLPPSATPTWAQAMPEDVWKKELLEGLRNHPQSHSRNSEPKPKK